MALKADRYEESTDISFFSNATATRGGVVCLADLGLASGAALDQGENLVSYQQITGASQIPVGILLNDVVDKDLTRTHLNQYKDEVQKGGKVTVLTRGWVVTNNVTGTPTAGALAYADGVTAGNVTAGNVDPNASGSAVIGRWMSRKDADGYAKLYVNLPNFA